MINIKEDLTFRNVLFALGVPEEKISENILELFSETDEFDIIYDTIKAVLSRKKYSLQEIREVMLCLDEAFSNAIMWGNKNEIQRKVIIKYYVSRELCVLSVQDQGEGYDVYSLASGFAGSNPISSPIRGLYLIHKYIDHIFLNTKGNMIIMVKCRTINGSQNYKR